MIRYVYSETSTKEEKFPAEKIVPFGSVNVPLRAKPTLCHLFQIYHGHLSRLSVFVNGNNQCKVGGFMCSKLIDATDKKVKPLSLLWGVQGSFSFKYETRSQSKGKKNQ